MAPKKGKKICHKKGEAEMPRKRRKVEREEKEEEAEAEKEERLEKAVEPLQMTDMNDNCLLDTFNHLSLVDLLNVAESNSRLKQVAEMVFKRKFASTMHIEYIQPHPDRNIEIDASKLLVKDLKSCLQILRCFGHLFDEVNLNGSLTDARFCKYIGQYLAKYCSKTIKKLFLREISFRHLFDAIQPSFAGVNLVVIDHCSIESGFSFVKLFPKLLGLSLNASRFENPKLIEKRFLRLKCVRMENVTGFDRKKFFRLNPQLFSLKLCTDYDPELIRCVNDYLPNLERLILYDLPVEFHDDELSINLNNIKSLALKFSTESANQPSSIVKLLPFSFGKLENLRVTKLSLNQNTLDCLANIEHLNELDLFEWKDEGNFIERLLHLENILTNVKTLNIEWGLEISFENIFHFLDQSKSIENFAFSVNMEKQNEIKSRLDDSNDAKWKIDSQHFERITIVRSGQPDLGKTYRDVRNQIKQYFESERSCVISMNEQMSKKEQEKQKNPYAKRFVSRTKKHVEKEISERMKGMCEKLEISGMCLMKCFS